MMHEGQEFDGSEFQQEETAPMTTPNVPKNVPCFIDEFGRTYIVKVYATDTPATAIPNERLGRIRDLFRKFRRGDFPDREQSLWDEIQAVLSELGE
jgi:hypothetical protein